MGGLPCEIPNRYLIVAITVFTATALIVGYISIWVIADMINRGWW